MGAHFRTRISFSSDPFAKSDEEDSFGRIVAGPTSNWTITRVEVVNL
jgi:hypothetical protein